MGFEPVMGSWWREDAPDVVVSGHLDRVADDETGYDWKLLLDGELTDIEPGYETSVTLFGDTARGPMTIHRAASKRWWSSSGTGDTRRTMTEWTGFWLIDGGHFPLDHLYRRASFLVPHAIDWLGPSRLNNYAHPVPLPTDRYSDGWMPMEEATLRGGMVLSAALARSTTFAPLGRRQEHEWRGYYSMDHESGLTFEQCVELAHAVGQLQSLAFGAEMGFYSLSLEPELVGEDYKRVSLVDPRDPAGHDWQGLAPFFDTSEIDFGSFIPAWLTLRKHVPLGESVIESKANQRVSVQVQLLAQCSALEALAQHYWQEQHPGLADSDLQILQALETAGIKSKSRKMVEAQLRQRRWPLERKLITAAAMMGVKSSRRLLGNIGDWSYLTMRLRNALTHGLQLPGALDEDVEFVAEVQRSVAAVLQLAMLRQLGYTNSLGGSTGEFLWQDADGRPIASHTNSDLLKDLDGMANRASQWAFWRQQIDES